MAEQRDCLAIEASADFQAEHHQTASRLPAWLELRAGAELACFGLLQGQCRSRMSPRARKSISLDGADQRRVHRDLRLSPRWEAVRDDLDSPAVRGGGLQVELPQGQRKASRTRACPQQRWHFVATPVVT